MSRLRANQITNENANGAPNFPHGLTVTGIVTATTSATTMSQIVVGSAVTANSQGIDVTGIVTATTFVGNLTGNPTGSGANLTNIPAGNLTGTVADARISTLTASKLTGALPAISGANLTNLPPSAPVGGASTNQVFFENDKIVEVGYQITSTKNAMSAGPISVSAGIAVTVPSGCSWTIV